MLLHNEQKDIQNNQRVSVTKERKKERLEDKDLCICQTVWHTLFKEFLAFFEKPYPLNHSGKGYSLEHRGRSIGMKVGECGIKIEYKSPRDERKFI